MILCAATTISDACTHTHTQCSACSHTYQLHSQCDATTWLEYVQNTTLQRYYTQRYYMFSTAIHKITVVHSFGMQAATIELSLTNNYWPKSKSNSGLESSHEAVGGTYQLIVWLHSWFLGKSSNTIFNEDDGHWPQPQKGKPHDEKCKCT